MTMRRARFRPERIEGTIVLVADGECSNDPRARVIQKYSNTPRCRIAEFRFVLILLKAKHV